MNNTHIAYCGYDCTKCPVYIATKNKNIELLKQIVITPGISLENQTVEALGCLGCCDKDNVNVMCKTCAIRTCSKEKELLNCGYCKEFPCSKLNHISLKTRQYLEEINKNMK